MVKFMKDARKIFISVIFIIVCSAGTATAGSEHDFGRAAGNCGGMWPLPDTGQTVSYSTATGDDAHYNPAATQPSYTLYNAGGAVSTTVDNRTGLMWVTDPVDAGISGAYLWLGAITACETIQSDGSYAGYTDWRLPNLKELQSIVDYSHGTPAVNTTYFLNTQSDYYWSSTTYAQSAAMASLVDFSNGTMTYSNKGTTYKYVRCVRGGP